MKKRWMLCLLAVLVLFTGCQKAEESPVFGSAPPAAEKANAQVHFLDVGQADSILIESQGEFMLIDAGNAADGKDIIAYLHQQGVTKLAYVVATHPHADHIGGMAQVLRAFPVDEILMPKVSHISKTFETLLDTIEEQGKTITKASAGQAFPLGGCTVHCLSPTKEAYPSLNLYSVVLRLDCGQTSFLLTGDAEEENEQALLSRPIQANVLKVGHHGSSTSSKEAFLDAVRPQYAVISVGKDNSYGHPDKEVLKLLQKRQIKIYRTDQNGWIRMRSDGQTITIETEKGT